MRSKIRKSEEVHVGSGNVFADLGLPDAANLLIQAELARLIYLRLRELSLTQVQAARRLGLKQPDVSKLMNGRYSGFSAERLLRLLTALDQDIEIIVRPKPAQLRRSGTLRVIAA
jgi:predicted XRE-type DNA-binding protein